MRSNMCIKLNLIYRCFESHLQLMRLIDLKCSMKSNHFVSMSLMMIQERFCCYCCSYHWLVFFLSGKIPCNCNIIVPLTVVDIRERILSEKIRPAREKKKTIDMNMVFVIFSFIQVIN